MNLAIVLTQLGRRVLLIDADLRRARLHASFGLPPARGCRATSPATQTSTSCPARPTSPACR